MKGTAWDMFTLFSTARRLSVNNVTTTTPTTAPATLPEPPMMSMAMMMKVWER